MYFVGNNGHAISVVNKMVLDSIMFVSPNTNVNVFEKSNKN